MKKLITIFVLTVYTSLCFLNSASLAVPSVLAPSAEPSALTPRVLPPQAEPYILAPGDILEIQILNRKDLNTKQEVGPAGKIDLPLVGRVTVEGMTLTNCEIFVKAQLSKYLDHPDVIIYLTPRPIHVIQHFLKTDTIVNKTATTIDEAKAYVGEGYAKEIHYGDTIYVDVGTEPTWWDNNWVAVIAALAVIVGIGVNLR
jgi:hypothetical protein